MRREIVVQIDATVMIGIIILMTFQSFSSTVYQKEYGEVVTEFRQLHAQYFVNQKLLEECQATTNNCDEYSHKLEEIKLQRQGIEDWVTSLNIAKNFNEFFSNVTFFSIGGSLIFNVINLFMIVPFAVSGVVESFAFLRSKKDDQATRLGVSAMMIGFAMVVVGFVLVIYLMNCATFVDQNCFGVNRIFSLPPFPTMP